MTGSDVVAGSVVGSTAPDATDVKVGAALVTGTVVVVVGCDVVVDCTVVVDRAVVVGWTTVVDVQEVLGGRVVVLAGQWCDSDSPQTGAAPPSADARIGSRNAAPARASGPRVRVR